MASWSPTISPDAVSENWSTVLLSLRDLRRDVPINYNQYPGIALTPACFGDGVYTDDKAACVANLIAIGYRSFALDLYLDGESGGWGVCPVASGSSDASDTASSSPAAAATTAPTTTTTTTTTTTAAAAAASSPAPLLLPRQSAAAAPAYSCAPSFNATTLLTIFDTWMTGTNTDLGARILLLTLSLHRAANTTLTAPPQPLTGTLRSANILADAYTPTHLLADRRNLNGSWYDDTETTNNTYFTTLFVPDGTASTPDGWPSESYLEFKVSKRVLVAYGATDPAVAAVYDPAATGDDAAIFPAGYLGAHNTSSSPSTPPCLYNTSSTAVSAGNSSWAQALSPAPPTTPANITALANCGYSTLLEPAPAAANTSLEERFRSYEELIRATAAWAWADNEPQNTTGRAPSFRCAAMRVADGRWFVADCNESRRAACRVDGLPYDWTLTPTALPYASQPRCFSAPRTPLENTHLHRTLQRTLAPHTDTASVWLALNSLATDSCWVPGGADADCPYGDGDDARREVIVSAVAAVIALVVFGLMWFAKGASWRVERSRRRRRRVAKKRVREGVEYEGVPS